jgi:glycosyltransferase 2 family protein
MYIAVGEEVFRPSTYQVEHFSVPLALLVATTSVVKWLAPAARVGLLCRRQGFRIPYRSALLVHLVAMFAAALAPQNTGFAPGTVAALRRLGIPVGRGIGVSVQIVILDMIFFALAVPTSIAYLALSATIRLPLGATLAALGIALLAVIAAAVLMRRPELVARLILAVARWPVMTRFAARLQRVAREYHQSATTFQKMSAASWLALHLATAAAWLSGFALLWALLRLYGIETGLLATLAILSTVTIVSHVVPTPGAAGFMEAAVGLSIGAHAGAAVLIWRVASFYLIFLLGPAATWLLYQSGPTPTAGQTTGSEQRPR